MPTGHHSDGPPCRQERHDPKVSCHRTIVRQNTRRPDHFGTLVRGEKIHYPE
jgi:hypothetical protein